VVIRFVESLREAAGRKLLDSDACTTNDTRFVLEHVESLRTRAESALQEQHDRLQFLLGRAAPPAG
jgi:hypothetical protein